jgi:hypothetical protein
MKLRHPGLALILIVELTGCSTRRTISTNILPVPPQDSRWERTPADRIALPLSSAGRTELENALRYGLNRNNAADNVATDANAPALYASLLDLLGKAATISDLSSPAYKKWLPGTMVLQVVDARDPVTPRSHVPVALSDGKFWWIFYRNAQDQLTGVMAVKVAALGVLIEKDR